MKRTLRIAIADDEVDMRDYLARILPRLGYEVVSSASNGKELIEQCRQVHPDLVITDIRMPEMDGIDAAVAIGREQTIPIILISAFHDPKLIERAEREHVLAYLVKPIKQADLDTAIALAVRRFEQFQALADEASPRMPSAADERTVERAVETLVKKAGLSEGQALARLNSAAADRRQRLVDIAQSVNLTEELLAAPLGASPGG